MLARIAKRLFRSVETFIRDYRKRGWREESSKYFNFLSGTLNVNPIMSTNTSSLPNINVTILVGPLDVEHCIWALQGVTQTSTNPIKRITLVTPAFQQNEVVKKVKQFEKIDPYFSGHIETLSDEDLMSEFPKIEKRLSAVREDRKNWYKQQSLKWICAGRGTLDNLIIDCELILLNSRTWLDSDGCQVHYLLNDLNPQYIVSCEDFFGVKLPKLDFVSHCAVFQRDILKDLTKADLQEFILRWLESGYRRFHPAPLSEWQTYANFIGSNFPKRLKIGVQKQYLITDSDKLHSLEFHELKVIFEDWDAIYISHKDRFHKMLALPKT